MTTLEIIGLGGFAATILINTAVGGFFYGRLSARLDGVEKAVSRDGTQSFVRSERVDLLVARADSEHRVMNSEINTLRERVHGHERVMGEHEVRLTTLEEASR